MELGAEGIEARAELGDDLVHLCICLVSLGKALVLIALQMLWGREGQVSLPGC